MSYLKYRGRVIRDCVGDHNTPCGGWIIQPYHEPTGNPWSDGLCPHYPSLRAAKESILADMEEGAANARLIAAAPSLLSSLEALMGLEGGEAGRSDDPALQAFAEGVWAGARAVVAEAKGEVEETPTA